MRNNSGGADAAQVGADIRPARPFVNGPKQREIVKIGYALRPRHPCPVARS